jgi:hypothetical protein
MRGLLAVGLVLLAGFAGADDKKPDPNPDPKATVAGAVVLDGKPLGECSVAFHPVKPADKGPVAYAGTTNGDGRFAIDLPPGEYVVTCLKVRVDPDTKKPVHITPQKYSQVKTSGITSVIKDGKQTFDIKLMSK